eukprot:CAMPEP_0177547534 /NCGR_PEP_ID=MMETSP0369-20130122/63903_1 /TAXON_ID=447022 ORGANISM="Scrippsiella hangoei-like, Strain SHHI-4" /NCGR_SAMPLE_ID=MMETSP0369 /ASSEMBLY_ACC=CAM_ASM_000364 /LENGTH=76 /DNA_ID=CAMNT_0019032301 /DNA_START=42 /DNA_END=269 /DNA_ORIENTATION=+
MDSLALGRRPRRRERSRSRRLRARARVRAAAHEGAAQFVRGRRQKSPREGALAGRIDLSTFGRAQRPLGGVSCSLQ